MPTSVARLNHAVLYVRELDRSVAFYQRVFDFEELPRTPGVPMTFLRARGGENHHDLGLMAVGPQAPQPPRGATGLYHLAWEVPALQDLAECRETLVEAGALVGQSDHGVSKSLYAKDPDGNEFEVMWRVPAAEWGEFATRGVVMPLNLERELAARA